MGSLASSAVVEAIADYRAYDDHVYTATMWSGAGCTDRIIQVTKYIMSQVDAGKKTEIIAKFGYAKTDIDIGDFYYMLADISAGAAQSGTRVKWCEELMKVEAKNDTLLDWFVSKSLPLVDYDARELANITIDFAKSSRQWVWQTCTHLGYFQTPGTHNGMRGNITMPYWYEFCKKVYGIPLKTDDHTWNMRYGGKNLAAT